MHVSSRSRRSALRASLAVAAAVAWPTLAIADDAYPSRPVTLIVPFPPGGGTDVAARIVAQKLSLRWGQPVIVENRAGAAGILGADAVAKAKPDGYTLLGSNVGTQSINPALYKKLPYNPDTAFAPISLVAELPMVLLATPTIPYKTIKDLVAAGKATPDKLTIASSGAGGSPHLSSELLQSMTGARFTHVPYKGGGPAMADVMAGHVDLLFASVLEASGSVKSGKLLGIAVSSKARSPALPNVPTIDESGVAGYESGSWVGYLAPAGTPPALIKKIADDIQAVMALPDTRANLTNQGALPRGTTPEAFAAQIDGDRKRYTRLIHDRNIHVD